jgi:hypothetical protein
MEDKQKNQAKVLVLVVIIVAVVVFALVRTSTRAPVPSEVQRYLDMTDEEREVEARRRMQELGFSEEEIEREIELMRERPPEMGD